MSSNIGTMAAVMPMLNLSKLYNGNASGAAVNFDDGKITAQTLSFAGKEVEDLWKNTKAQMLMKTCSTASKAMILPALLL